jgi:hypothetical protein
MKWVAQLGSWLQFLALLVVLLLAIYFCGFPPRPGSLQHIHSQLQPSAIITLTVLCLFVASFWIYRRHGYIFKIQAIILWLLFGTTLFCAACSVYESYTYLRFEQNMLRHYEVKCDEYYSIYASSDIAGAKKALGDTIDLSLTEKKKASHYWRFDLAIAFSQARLAVIDENQGDNEEAARLFSSASDYMVLQTKAFREEMRKTGDVRFTDKDSDAEVRWTPDRWRQAIAALDKQSNVRWKSSNN